MYLSVCLVFALGYGGLHARSYQCDVRPRTNAASFAYKGENVVLNCSRGWRERADYIEEVIWKREDGNQNVLVLLYQNNNILSDSSHRSYRDRVKLFPNEIPKGNFSLQLMDVRLEDKGTYTCEVNATNTCTRTSVNLDGVGFIAPHIGIFVLCSVALVLAVGLSGPVWNLLRKNGTTSKDLTMHVCLILCPNICMFAAFILWSTEATQDEECLHGAVKTLAVPLYHSIITMATCSSFFRNTDQIRRTAGHTVTVLIIFAVVTFISTIVLAVSTMLRWAACRIQQTACLEILNLVLFGLLLSSNRNPYPNPVNSPTSGFTAHVWRSAGALKPAAIQRSGWLLSNSNPEDRRTK